MGIFEHKNPVKFPAQTPSKLIFNNFQEMPVVGKEYYFDDDNTFLGTIITGIKFHFYGGPFANWYLSPHFKQGSINYNTVFYGEMRKMLITLLDKDQDTLLEDIPVATLLANYGSLSNVYKQKYLRRYHLPNLSLKASFVRFTELPVTPLPFTIPFTFFYRIPKK